jgi:hypothetical protein
MKASSLLVVGAICFIFSGIFHAEALPASPKLGESPAVGTQSRFAGWNVEYTLPPRWTVAQKVGRLQTLASTTEAGAIFLAPGMYRNANEAIADLSQFYLLLTLQAYPVESPQSTTIAGLQAIVATYVSTDQTGRTVQGRFISLLTPHGTGLNMLALTTADHMPGLRATLERLAASVKAEPPTVNQQAVAALAGNWVLYAGAYGGGSSVTGSTAHSHEESVVFDGRGSYRWQSSSSVSVTTPGESGGAGRATSDADEGTYTVIDSTLVAKGTKGQFAIDFQIQGNKLLAGGKTYLRN